MVPLGRVCMHSIMIPMTSEEPLGEVVENWTTNVMQVNLLQCLGVEDRIRKAPAYSAKARIPHGGGLHEERTKEVTTGLQKGRKRRQLKS
eukprot:949678-Amphidinium_carterae.4